MEQWKSIKNPIFVRIINSYVSLFHQSATGGTSLSAVEYMDDGSPIEVTIDINKNEGTAYIDFTGTGPQVYTAVYSIKSTCTSNAVSVCIEWVMFL